MTGLFFLFKNVRMCYNYLGMEYSMVFSISQTNEFLTLNLLSMG